MWCGDNLLTGAVAWAETQVTQGLSKWGPDFFLLPPLIACWRPLWTIPNQKPEGNTYWCVHGGQAAAHSSMEKGRECIWRGGPRFAAQSLFFCLGV